LKPLDFGQENVENMLVAMRLWQFIFQLPPPLKELHAPGAILDNHEAAIGDICNEVNQERELL
jgi:hypothetical protein